LRDKRHHRLGFDGTVLESIYDRLLDFGGRTSLSPYQARIGNRDEAFAVDILVRQADEVSRPYASFERNEQTACSRLKDGYADNVADAEANFIGRPTVRESVTQPRRVGLNYTNRLWIEPH
jgi:hypothetical protein